MYTTYGNHTNVWQMNKKIKKTFRLSSELFDVLKIVKKKYSNSGHNLTYTKLIEMAIKRCFANEKNYLRKEILDLKKKIGELQTTWNKNYPNENVYGSDEDWYDIIEKEGMVEK